MLVIQLSYSDMMPIKRYYYFSYESVLDFLRESALWLREWLKHAVREGKSVQRYVMFISFLDINKTYPKQRDYLFFFNLNLDLLTLAHENFHFNTLDLEKVQGKNLGCIKSWGDPSLVYCTPTLQGATAEGWKSPMRLARLPTPALGITWSEDENKNPIESFRGTFI